MKHIYIIFILIGIGCTPLRVGEVRTIRDTTFGLIIAYDPITQLPIAKIGWNELQYIHAYKADVDMKAEHNDINLLLGQGSIKRGIKVTNP